MIFVIWIIIFTSVLCLLCAILYLLLYLLNFESSFDFAFTAKILLVHHVINITFAVFNKLYFLSCILCLR